MIFSLKLYGVKPKTLLKTDSQFTNSTKFFTTRANFDRYKIPRRLLNFTRLSLFRPPGGRGSPDTIAHPHWKSRERTTRARQ